MDGTHPALSSPRLSSALFLIGLLSLAAACFSPQANTLPTPSKERFSEIKKRLGELRGLQAKTDFESAAWSDDISQLTANASDANAVDSLQAVQMERAYKQLGLLSASDDLKTALKKYHRLEQLIAYDSTTGRLMLAPDASRFGRELQPPYSQAATELPLALGVVRALQEQHFQWQEKIGGILTDDSRLAYRAIAGGDALLTALAYLTDGNLAAAAHLTAAWQISQQMEKQARDLPPFLSSQLVFPLREGSNFVAWAIKARGSEGLNALYANPPYATAQILHPEKYYLTPQPAHRFHPAGLLRHLDMPVLFEQCLGEFLTRGLLETEQGLVAASQIAAGWRGDQLFFFDHKGLQTTVWYSSWASAAEAAVFQRAFQSVVETRQRTRLRTTAGRGDDVLTARTRDRGSFALARKDNIVIYLVSSADRFASTIDATWNDLAVEITPEAVRFDSARGPAQLSLSKR